MYDTEDYYQSASCRSRGGFFKKLYRKFIILLNGINLFYIEVYVDENQNFLYESKEIDNGYYRFRGGHIQTLVDRPVLKNFLA